VTVDVALPIFDGITALDAIGPSEVLSRGPDARVHFLGIGDHWLLLDKLGELAARIAGEDTARAIQLAIEYDPEPPFDSGSTSKASPEIIELARNRS
jgi:hypothetical protein